MYLLFIYSMVLPSVIKCPKLIIIITIFYFYYVAIF